MCKRLPKFSSWSFARLNDSAIGAFQPVSVIACVRPAIMDFTSGKSTQKAFMFNPYMKAAKFSLNRAKLSCINCKCIIFASKSAIESDNSPKEGSNASRGTSLTPATLALDDSRKDEREDARNGVVGRERGCLEFDAERVILLRPPTCGVVEEDMFGEHS